MMTLAVLPSREEAPFLAEQPAYIRVAGRGPHTAAHSTRSFFSQFLLSCVFVTRRTQGNDIHSPPGRICICRVNLDADECRPDSRANSLQNQGVASRGVAPFSQIGDVRLPLSYLSALASRRRGEAERRGLFVFAF